MKFIMFRLSIAVVIILLTSGCTTIVKSQSLVLADFTPEKKHPYSVSVKTGSDKNKSAPGMINITNGILKEAIEETILKTQTFQYLAKEGEADYGLSAVVMKIQQPMMGLSFTVKADVAWVLNKGDKLIWRKVIPSEHTTGATEAFVGVTRVRLATEGAIKNNIELALKDIAKLNL